MRKLPAFTFIAALGGLGLLLAGPLASPAAARIGYENLVKFKWAPVPKARAYSVQILEGERVVLEKPAAAPSFETELPPGKYGYRISSVDQAGRPGPWSARKELVIHPGPPLPSGNQKKEIAFKHDPVDETLHWEEAEAATSYRLRVWQGEQLLVEKEVNGDSAAVNIPAAGNYRFALASIHHGLQGPFGPEFQFAAVQFILASPGVLLPTGRVRLDEGEKVKLSWKKVEGADAYRVELRRQKKWRAAVQLSRRADGAPDSPKWRGAFSIQGAERVAGKDVELLDAESARRAPAAEADYQVQTFVTPANSLTVELPAEGVYVWKVRAIAGQPANQSGPEAQADFELIRP